MRLVRAPPVGAARWNRGAPDVPVRAEESLADALLGFLTQLLGVVLTRLPQAREKASHMHIYDQMRQLSMQQAQLLRSMLQVLVEAMAQPALPFLTLAISKPTAALLLMAPQHLAIR